MNEEEIYALPTAGSPELPGMSFAQVCVCVCVYIEWDQCGLHISSYVFWCSLTQSAVNTLLCCTSIYTDYIIYDICLPASIEGTVGWKKLKNGVLWGVTPCGSCKNRSMHRLLVTDNAVPSSPIIVTLMKEALSSSETSVLTRATWRNIPDDAILHSHRRQILKSYIALIGWTL
jgi:hypothetical protein